MLRELPSLSALVQVISLRAALMPENASASIKLRFSQHRWEHFPFRDSFCSFHMVMSILASHAIPSISAFLPFPGPSSGAGRGVAFLKLAGANAKAMAGVE